MSRPSSLTTTYPWTTTPLIVSAPMFRIALSPLAVAVSLAGGFGFLATGFDVTTLSTQLKLASDLISESPPNSPARKFVSEHQGMLPIGVGFLNWGADLEASLKVLEECQVAAVWVYAPYRMEDLRAWSDGVRRVSGGKTEIWIQIGSVELAIQAVELCKPDVIVVQGCDAGGHGLVSGAGIITLLPEVVDAFEERGWRTPVLAAGGIVDGRGLAACLNLGARGCVMGTRFIVAEEAEVKEGYWKEIIRASDGGVTTVRSTVYDHVRGIHGWPQEYNGRGVINKSYEDSVAGVDEKENERLYSEAMKNDSEGWGPQGRLCTYAGTGVGLIKKRSGAQEIIEEVRADAIRSLKRTADLYTR